MKNLSLMILLILLIGCRNNQHLYDAIGTFQATELIISSEIAGNILSLDPVEGDRLEKGTVAGIIDSTQLYLQKQQLLQNIEALEAGRPAVSTQLAPLKKQLEKQQVEKNRIENLLASDAATGKQLDDINAAISVLEKQLAAQENTLRNTVTATDAQIAVLRTQVAQVEDRLKKCRIQLPVSGTVLAKYAQAGEITSAGRPLMKVADTEQIHLKAYVTSAQLSGIKLGDEVSVRADFGEGNYREYPGKISWISDKSEFTPKNITTSDERANMVYAIKIAVSNDGYLKLGLYGEVKFKH